MFILMLKNKMYRVFYEHHNAHINALFMNQYFISYFLWWCILQDDEILCHYIVWNALTHIDVLYHCIPVVQLFHQVTRQLFFYWKKKYSSFKLVWSTFELNTKEIFFPIHIGFKCKHIGFLLLRFLFFYKPKFIYISTSRFYAESFLRLRVHPTSVHFFETVYYSFFKIKDKMLKKGFLW